MGDAPWSSYITPVLVWCKECRRYISNEERHPCVADMDEEYRRERRIRRVIKSKELMG